MASILVSFYEDSNGRNRFVQPRAGTFGGDNPDESITTDAHYRASAVYRDTVTEEAGRRQRCPTAGWYAAGIATVAAADPGARTVTLRWTLGRRAMRRLRGDGRPVVTVALPYGGGVARGFLLRTPDAGPTATTTTRHRAVFRPGDADPWEWPSGATVAFTLRSGPPTALLPGPLRTVGADVVEFEGDAATRWSLPRPGRDLVHLGGRSAHPFAVATLDSPERARDRVFAVVAAEEVGADDPRGLPRPLRVEVQTTTFAAPCATPAASVWWLGAAAVYRPVGWTAAVGAGSAPVSAALLLVPAVATDPVPTDCPGHVLVVDRVRWTPAPAEEVEEKNAAVSVVLETDGPGLEMTTSTAAVLVPDAAAAVLVLPRTHAGSAWWRPAQHGGPWREYRIAGRWDPAAAATAASPGTLDVSVGADDSADGEAAVDHVGAVVLSFPPDGAPSVVRPTVYGRRPALPAERRIFRIRLSKAVENAPAVPTAAERGSTSSAKRPRLSAAAEEFGFAEVWADFRCPATFHNGTRVMPAALSSCAFAVRQPRQGRLSLAELILPRRQHVAGTGRTVCALPYLWVFVRHRALRPRGDGCIATTWWSTITGGNDTGAGAGTTRLLPPAWVLHRDTVCFAVSVPNGRIPSLCPFMSCSGSAAVAVDVCESPAAAAPEICIVLPSGAVLDWEEEEDPAQQVRESLPDDNVGIHTHLTLQMDDA
jgi:hypothetical protein